MERDKKTNNTNNFNQGGFSPPPRPTVPQQKNLPNDITSIPSENIKAKSSKQGKKTIKKPGEKVNRTKIEDNLTQEEKAKKSRLKKFGVLSIVGVLLVAAIIASVFLIINKIRENSPLQIPSDAQKLLIVESDNVYYAIAPLLPEAQIYTFEIKNTSNQTVSIPSQTNIATVTGAFNEKQKYLVRYFVQKAGNEKTKSKPTDWVEFNAFTKLSQPQISFDKQDNVLYWNAIINADYYSLFYSTKQGVQIKNITTLPNQDGKVVVGLESLDLEFGEYEFSLTAVSNNADIYKVSSASNKLLVSYSYQLPQPVSATYNFLNNVLTIVLQEKVDDLKIEISYEDSMQTAQKLLTYTPTQSLLEYSINLADFNNLTFEQGQKVFITLTSSKEFVMKSQQFEIDFTN